MLRRERRRGGRGDRVKEEAGAVGGTDDGYIGTVDVKRYNFYSLFFSLISAIFSSQPLLLLPL